MTARRVFIALTALAGVALWCALSLTVPKPRAEAPECNPAVLWGCP